MGLSNVCDQCGQYLGVAQSGLEHPARNREVAGSNPAAQTSLFPLNIAYFTHTSEVRFDEQQLVTSRFMVAFRCCCRAVVTGDRVDFVNNKYCGGH